MTDVEQDDAALPGGLVQKVWDTQALQEDFTVLSFAAPFVRVKRKSDGVLGWMEFNHRPRRYYNFVKGD